MKGARALERTGTGAHADAQAWAAAYPEAFGRSLFVAGTDTGVGKTLLACALLRALGARGLRVLGMKPVAAGAQARAGLWHNEDVDALQAAGFERLPDAAICPFLLEAAIAPHLAAQDAGARLAWAPVRDAFGALLARGDGVVVEGVGGFRVPLGEDWDTAELARLLGLPVVLVVGMRLGCLNHALLTAEAIAARGLRLCGWVANCIDPDMAEQARNIDALGARLAAPLLGRVPWSPGMTPASALRHLDIDRLGALPRGARRP